MTTFVWYLGVLKLSGLGFLGYQFYQNISFYYRFRSNKYTIIDILYDYDEIIPKMYPMNRISKDEWNYFEKHQNQNQNGILDFYTPKMKKDIYDIIAYRKKIDFYIITNERNIHEIIEESSLKRIFDLVLHINIFYWERFHSKGIDGNEWKDLKKELKMMDKGLNTVEKYVHQYFNEKPILYFDSLGIYNSMIYLPILFYFTHKWFF